MKYYLAFDKGGFRNINDRYVRIPNNLIHKDLDMNNNLKKLCYFAMQFERAQDLKSLIIRLDPRLSIYRYYDLVIMWNRKYKGVNYIKAEDVPYKSDMVYFDLEALVKIILNNIYEPFFKNLYMYFKNHDYLREELDSLYDMILEYKDDYIIEDAIRVFLRKATMGKKGIEFSKLYKMVMLILRLSGESLDKKDKLNVTPELKEDYSGLSEEQQFEAEWLIRRARLRKLNVNETSKII